MEIKVLSYNIHKGFSSRNQHFVLENIRHAIRHSQADIVALQEVLGEHKTHGHKFNNWEQETHFEYLADSVWPHNSYGKNAIYNKGHHGNVILSKYPIHNTKNHNISHWWFSKRGILHAEVLDNLHIACVHMGFLPFEQSQQIKKLRHWLETCVPAGAPVIIMGDFNDWHLQLHRVMTQKMGLIEAGAQIHKKPLKTYPSSRPRMAMDRIYYRGLHLSDAKVSTGFPWNTLSDHCPIQATFTTSQP